jgi:predicted SnoaL-like aldol condensation-catalyzing enzyme
MKHPLEEVMTEENKKLVHDFYDLAFNQHKPREAAKLYIGDQYIQHNPFVPNGVAPFVEHFEGYFREHPKSHVVFSHIVAEGDLVVLHLNSKAAYKDRGRAIVDIFRVKSGKIVEHWDVTQNVPEKTASGNTMF